MKLLFKIKGLMLVLLIFISNSIGAFTTCLSASVNGSGTSLDLYWVGHLENGGSGNWSDPCSWRVGGVNGTERPAQGPRPVDNVFFTDLGFTASTSTVNINSNSFCASLTMDASFTNTVVFGATNSGRVLTVGNGSVGGFSLADPSTLDFNYIGQIFFVWDGSHDIELNGNELKCRLNFDNASGVFNFTSGAWLTGFMNAHSPFYLRAGTINTNNFTFDIPSLRVNSAGVINGGTSIFNISGVTNAWGSNPIYSVSNNLDLDDCVFNLSSGVANQRIRTGVNDMGDMNLLGEDVVYAFYHHFTCVGDVELAEKSTFNTSIGGAGATITGDLLLNGSSSIQLSSGGFSVGSLSQGPGVDCGSINTIRGLNTSRILTSSSNVSLHDVLLENVEAGNSASSGGSGSLTYSVSGAVDLGGNSFWDLTTSSAQVLHWTGGAGDSLWSSGGNWDLGCVPGPQDSVVFENMNGEVVNLDVDGYVNSIHWVSDGTSGEFISPSVSALNVYGHFTLNPTMDWDLTSTITFRGGNHTMDFSTQTLNNHLFFENAEYTLLSDLDNPNGIRQLRLRWSTIHAVGRTIDIGRVLAYQSSTINADNTTFNIYYVHSWYDWRGELVPNFTNGSVVNFLHNTPRIYGAGNANVLDMPSFTTVAGSLLRVNRSASSSMEVHGDVTLGGGAYFNGTAATHLLMKDITIDGDLSFAGGNTILIAGGTNRTFTVTGDFTATGTGCHTSTFIQTAAGSGQVMFDVQGTTTLDFVTLENLDADGFTSPVASNVNDLGGNDNWATTTGSGGAMTFYWRADLTSPTTFSGNWSDPNFWTTTQTNTVGDGTCVPTSADNVVFDNLSHDGTGMTSVALSGSNYCHDFTVSNSNARLTGTGNFYISGSLDADATFHSLGGAFSGNYRFNSTDPAGETISAVNRLQGSIIFDSGDGDWSLASDIETHSHFSFLNGNFNTNGHDMYIRLNVNISGNQVGNLDMSGSTIDVNIWSMNGISNISFVAPELIKVRHWIRPRDLIYNNVESAGTSNFIIYFNTGGVGATFKRVDISTPNSTIFGSNTFDTINYVASAGVTGNHRLQAGKTQTLTSPNGQIFAQGNPSGVLYIKSTVTGTMATIHKDHGTQMCWDYVVLQDLESSEDTDATTATPFIFGGVNNTTTNVIGPLWDFTRGPFIHPTVDAGPDQEICRRDSLYISFELGESGPYDIIYSDGTTNDTIFGIPHGVGTYHHQVYPTATTTYTILELLGDNCNSKIPGTIIGATQQIIFPPINNLSIDGDSSNCYLNDDNDWLTFLDDVHKRPILSIRDTQDGTVLGTTDVTVRVDGTVQTYNSVPYLQRHFGITPSTSGAAVVRFYITQSELEELSMEHCGSPSCLSVGDLVVTKFDNDNMDFTGALTWLNPSASGTETSLSQDITTTSDVHYIEVPVSSFSHFLIHPSSSPLPITLDYFEAKPDQNRGLVNLDWKTISEQNNDYFVVERSRDAINWQELLKVDGAGNSSSPITYHEEDQKPLIGLSYYRLKQVDEDGEITYTAPQAVNFYKDAISKLFPNPVSSDLNIDYYSVREGTVTIEILDVHGQIVHQSRREVSKKNNQLHLSCDHLNNGIYILRISSEYSTVPTQMNFAIIGK